MNHPVKMHVTYRPKPGKEEELFALVKKHGPALASTGLITGDAPADIRATDNRTGEKFFIETFAWRDQDAPNLAQQMPEVMAVWEPMTPILEKLELAVVEQVSGEK